jgi:MFS family permease
MRETGIRLPRRAESPEPPPSVDEQLERLGFGRFQWIALVAFVCFIVADGMELVVTNIIWSVLPLEDWGAPDFYRATLVSVSFLGFVFGALLGGFAGDVYGRLWLIYGHSIIFIPTSILSALSQSIAMLLVTRFFVGFSIGLVLPAVVSMMSEICPASHRGRAVLAIPGISYTVGQVAILLSGIYFISLYGFDCTGCEWWRWMLVAGVIPDAVGVCIVLAFVPESPRFLLYQGRLDRVQEVLQLIARTNDKESNLKHDGACRALPDDEEFCDVFKSAGEGQPVQAH